MTNRGQRSKVKVENHKNMPFLGRFWSLVSDAGYRKLPCQSIMRNPAAESGLCPLGSAMRGVTVHHYTHPMGSIRPPWAAGESTILQKTQWNCISVKWKTTDIRSGYQARQKSCPRRHVTDYQVRRMSCPGGQVADVLHVSHQLVTHRSSTCHSHA